MLKFLLYFAGFLPSLIWLSFYLRKDSHPEPNRMVLKVFFFGMLSGFVAILFERAFQQGQNAFLASAAANSLMAVFFGGALIEELVKWFSSKIGTDRNAELDEPVDLMLYMIISALGFAALENILVLSNYHPVLTPTKVGQLMLIRFASATFLHALCSGIFGYFIAWSAFHNKRRKLYFLIGLGLAFFLHGLYNWSIMNIQGLNKFVLPVMILITLSLWVAYGFKRLKKLKSVCNLYL